MEKWIAAIEAGLHPRDFFTLQAKEQVSSTNAVVKEWGRQGFSQGAVLLAGSQTHGRGRLGRSFYSPAETGRYFSVLLRPNLPAEKALLITTAAAVAVAESLGEKAAIKWVNDVFLHGRKVCGILTESGISDGRLTYAVLGIGLNLTAPKGGFPAELQTVAGGIFETAPTEEQTARFISDILNRFYRWYQDLEAPELLSAYEQRNLLTGQRVTVGNLTGRVEGIDSAFRLLVREETGQLHALCAGEATIGSTKIGEE